MSQSNKSKALHARRQRRIRHHIREHGGARVRLSVFRSGRHIYAQLIDDAQGITLASASSLDPALKGKSSGPLTEAAKAVGVLIAQRAREAKVEKVVFDRSGYLFHGRIKALADAARETGLVF
ncbi:MAG: 50S ribosomal protein L18 [Alphaproteobacteria bacterium]|nr:50S ribosomal protein L18 [Alphaproteobacteria bacterium]